MPDPETESPSPSDAPAAAAPVAPADAPAAADAPGPAPPPGSVSPAADAPASPAPAAPASTAPAIVEVRDVRKVYVQEDKPLEVLKGVSLTIRAGEVVSIVGPSGAGKSTLLHMIGTLDGPTSGAIVINGQDVTKLSNVRVAALRNETIGFVFQFHHLLPEFTALENVMMPGMIKGGIPRTTLEANARAILKDVRLDHRLHHRPSELSGGEQQRVALARALVLKPKILLADEPTGNLDTANSEHMNSLFFHLNRLHGTTMVIVTHNEGLASRVPRVVRMEDGKVVGDEYNAEAAAAIARATDPGEAKSGVG